MKSIELTQSQIKALEEHATMLIFPCKHNIIASDNERTVFKAGEWQHNIPTDLYIKDFAPLQKGDKYVWVKEEFYQNEQIFYKAEGWSQNLVYESASQMTKEQSRYSIDCLEVKIAEAQEIDLEDAIKIYDKKFCDEDGLSLYDNIDNICSNLNIDYGNDYVFLVEVKLNKDKK